MGGRPDPSTQDTSICLRTQDHSRYPAPNTSRENTHSFLFGLSNLGLAPAPRLCCTRCLELSEYPAGPLWQRYFGGGRNPDEILESLIVDFHSWINFGSQCQEKTSSSRS